MPALPDNEKARHANAAGLESDSPRERTRAQHITAKPFAVITVRSDGRRRVFQRYDNRAQAAAVAETLRRVGCDASVECEA
jgi:hypothetical protein